MPAVAQRKRVSQARNSAYYCRFQLQIERREILIEWACTRALVQVQQYSVRNLVVDPVLVSTSGCSLADSSCIPALKRRLFPLATVITPNTVEASALLGDFPIDNLADMEEAAKKLHAFGPKYVLVRVAHEPQVLERKRAVNQTGLLVAGRSWEATAFCRPLLSRNGAWAHA